MTEADATVIKAIRRKVNGRTRAPRAPRVAPITMAGIEAFMGGPIDFMPLYARSSSAVLQKLFVQAAAQQLRDYVNRIRQPTKNRPALDDDALRYAIRNWVPEIRRRGKSPVEHAAKFIGSMTAEEKAELIGKLQSNALGFVTGSGTTLAD